MTTPSGILVKQVSSSGRNPGTLLSSLRVILCSSLLQICIGLGYYFSSKFGKDKQKRVGVELNPTTKQKGC